MHLIAEASAAIARDPAAVFAYAADLGNFAAWFPGVVAIRAEDALPITQPGKRYREQVRIGFGRERTIAIAVKQAEPDRRLVTEGAFAPLLPRMEMVVTPSEDGGARLNWRMHSRSRSWPVRLLLLPLARRVMQKRAAIAMVRLKRILEG